MMDVHQYLSDEESAIFGTSYSDLYDNSVLWTDKQIATILAALERYGLRDNTVVVIASDHGEAFQEHGNEGHAKDLPPIVSRTTDTRHSDKLAGRGPFRNNVRRYDKWVHCGAMWPYPGGFRMLRK